MKRLNRNLDAFLALTVACASFLIYLRTLAPDVMGADGGEFQFAAWNFSFVHPTGYPLFLILGGLFQHLVPIGNPAYRLNLFTALTAALAVAALYLAINQITRQRAASFIAAASFAVTRTFWYDASAAETYALNAFFLALLIFLALRWQAELSARTFAVFCFVYGLALTHHRTIILWLPAFTLFFVVVAWRSRHTSHVTRHMSHVLPFDKLRAGCFTLYVLLPLLLYLYIPLRAPASPYAVLTLAPGRDIVLYDNSPNGFVNYVMGRAFQYEIGWDAVSAARLSALPQRLLDQFGGLGGALGGIGFGVMAWRREWARLALMLTGFAVTVLFASVYHIGDILHYYIPAYLLWAIWIGVASAWFLEQASHIPHPASRNILPACCLLLAACCLLLAALLLVPQVTFNFPHADRSRETQAREQWTRLLAAPIPPNAILISNDRDEMMPLWYIQYVENTRRDVLGLFPLITPAPQHANIGRLTDSVLDAGRPVFFVKAMPGIQVKYRVAALDGLVRVLGHAADAPPQFVSQAVLADRVRVLGYAVTREPGGLRVAVYWQVRAKLGRNYTSFIHLLDAAGNKVVQGNDHLVGDEYYPTTLWQVGETLRDEHIVTLPPQYAPGTYKLLVGMYSSADLQRLGEPVVIGAVEIGK